jgi:hypothetical protein
MGIQVEPLRRHHNPKFALHPVVNGRLPRISHFGKGILKAPVRPKLLRGKRKKSEGDKGRRNYLFEEWIHSSNVPFLREKINGNNRRHAQSARAQKKAAPIHGRLFAMPAMKAAQEMPSFFICSASSM